MEQRKMGTLVAIPIKGRKLVNRSGRKQSPFIQLKLGEQSKRTKASLIASAEPEWDQEIRLDVYENFGSQGAMDMSVAMFDEGKKNEKIGEGIFKLHEVIDKGELDVWFPVKHKGAITAEIYFELTYYALAPVTPVSHMPMQRPIIRPGQPGFIPPGASPYSPPPHMPVYGNVPRPQPPFPVGFQQPPPMVYTHSPNPMPYPVPHQQHPMSPPPRVPGPPNAMGFNPPFHVSSPPPMSGPSGRPNLVPQPYPPNNPGFTSPPRFPAPHQHQPQGGMPMGMPGPGPRPTSRPMGPGQGHGYRPGPGPGPGQNFNARPGHYHNQPGRPSGPMVTPLVQHHNIGSFP